MANATRVVFATFGSLGDLHPYIAVARELRQRGHRPLIASFEEHREAVETAGVEFAPMRPALSAFGERTAMMEQLFDPWRGPELMVRTMFMPNLRESYQDLASACRGADLLVTHPLAFAGPLLAQKEGLRWVSTALSPMTLFSATDPPLFPAAPWMRWARRLGIAPYRLLFRIPRAMVRRWEQPLREFRAELGLPATDAIAQFEGQHSPRLNLALFSRVFAAPQPDWPVHTIVCGFPPEDLGAVPPTVKAFRYLPYSAVFPRALAIAHSGGIGTLAQALAAGRPQLIVPVAFDQPDNARRAVKLGAARSIPFGKTSADALVRELGRLLAAPDFGLRARAIGEEVAREDGASAACNALERGGL